MKRKLPSGRAAIVWLVTIIVLLLFVPVIAGRLLENVGGGSVILGLAMVAAAVTAIGLIGSVVFTGLFGNRPPKPPKPPKGPPPGKPK